MIESFFTKIADELVMYSEYDPELADGIKWLDEQAQKQGITFYEMMFQVLHRHDTNNRAKEWLRKKD